MTIYVSNSVLGAAELIKVDQDPLGFQGRVVKDSAPDATDAETSSRYQIFGKKAKDGSVNVRICSLFRHVPLTFHLILANFW